MEHRLGEFKISERPRGTNEKPRVSHEVTGQGMGADMTNHVEQAPYVARLRMIILLSLICWAMLIAGAALVIG